MTGALTRYRVMAFIVGTALLALTVVVIFQLLGFHPKTAEAIVAPIHGYLYLIYLITAADLGVRARWGIVRFLTVICAGFVPGLAFYIEHRITRQMRAEWSAEAHAGPKGNAEPGPAPEPSAGPTNP